MPFDTVKPRRPKDVTVHRPNGREQLDLFQALPGDLAPRDAQDLMAYPFFSLAKSHRTAPIDFRSGDIAIRVEAVPEHGMATIWDADILIWAASQIVEARDQGIRSSRLMAATPYEIPHLHTPRHVDPRLPAAEGGTRPAAITTIHRPSQPIRQPSDRRMHRFSWVNEWKERLDGAGRPLGVELVVPDWFLRGRHGRRARAHYRPRLFRPDRRPGNVGSTGWSGSTVAGSAPAGGLTSTTSTKNPARCPRSAGLLSSYATSSAASRCRATRCFSKPTLAGASCSRSSGTTLWISCGRARAIGNGALSCHQEHRSRAIRNTNRV